MDFLSSIFGSKPQIADYTPVDLSAEQIKALQGDIAAWPDIQQLGNLYQQYMLNAYETAIPGFRDILAMGGQTTKQMLSAAESELSGQIPQDVQQQIQRSTAFQSLMGGTAGSPMAGALTARDLGLTSLDLISQGANLAGQAGNAAQRWAALSGAQLPEGMLVTPQQQAALDMQQNLIERNIQQQKYNVAAAPDPALQALNQWVEQVGGSVIASYAGGGMGGMGGGKGGAGYATSYNPALYGAGDISAGNYAQGTGGATPGFVPASSAMAPMDMGGTAGYYGGYGGVSPNYYGIGANPFTDYQGLNLADQYAYQSNFPG